VKGYLGLAAVLLHLLGRLLHCYRQTAVHAATEWVCKSISVSVLSVYLLKGGGACMCRDSSTTGFAGTASLALYRQVAAAGYCFHSPAQVKLHKALQAFHTSLENS
jgi:hypothetical protein